MQRSQCRLCKVHVWAAACRLSGQPGGLDCPSAQNMLQLAQVQWQPVRLTPCPGANSKRCASCVHGTDGEGKG